MEMVRTLLSYSFDALPLPNVIVTKTHEHFSTSYSSISIPGEWGIHVGRRLNAAYLPAVANALWFTHA